MRERTPGSPKGPVYTAAATQQPTFADRLFQRRLPGLSGDEARDVEERLDPHLPERRNGGAFSDLLGLDLSSTRVTRPFLTPWARTFLRRATCISSSSLITVDRGGA
jgi:hypothetical protein